MVGRRLLLSAVLVFSGFVSTAQAEEGRAYIGLKGVGSFLSEVQDVTTVGMTAFQINNDEDLVAGAGGVLGYSFGDVPLRAEFEVGYRFRFDFDARDNGPPTIGYENNLNTTTALVNLAWEIRHFGKDWVPYLGASVGWARNTSEIDRNNFAGAIVTTENSTDNLALGVMAGLSWYVTDSFGVDIGYRFINLGEVDSGPLAGGESFKADNYTSNEVTLSLNYRF
ncbi:outer membrane protein [Hwanghaeella sp.]|uniref:outer membrane protein n=1 Tax=Hwanghaeella sp. TaxID=2605943 RepID=UPI003CCBDEFA